MNTVGTLFKVTLYGESHQDAIGVVIDGVPPGLAIDEDQIHKDLSARKPGGIGTTSRIEKDAFTITSGVFNGHATGSPIHVMLKNKDVRSKDYSNVKHHPRPGHADFVAAKKYKGFHDYRGGGRFSGRLTAAIVCAGSIAKMLLPFKTYHKLVQVGSLKDMTKLDEYLKPIAEAKDSVGGIIQLWTDPLPIGLGEPNFYKLDGEIAKILFSIPAVKGVDIGTGFEGISLYGSEFNDAIEDETGKTITNHSGGISGGLSNGNPLSVRVMVKPPSSIGKPQNTYHQEKAEKTTLTVKGRHDACIARRAGIVLENALAIVLADMVLLNQVHKTFTP